MYFDLPDFPKGSAVVLKQSASESGHYATAAKLNVPLVWYPKAVAHTGSHWLKEDWTGHPQCNPGHQIMSSLLYGTITNEMLNVCQHGFLQEDVKIEAPADVQEEVKCMKESTFAVYAHTMQDTQKG